MPFGLGDEVALTGVEGATVDCGRGFRLRKFRVAASAPPELAELDVDELLRSTDALDPRLIGEGAAPFGEGVDSPCVETVETEPSSLGGGGCEMWFGFGMRGVAYGV